MKALSLIVIWLCAAVMVTGCASSGVKERQTMAGDEKIARPDRIILYDFACGVGGRIIRLKTAFCGSIRGVPRILGTT